MIKRCIREKRIDAKLSNPVIKKVKNVSGQSFSTHLDNIIYLQKAIGNKAVNRLIKSGRLQSRQPFFQPTGTGNRENYKSLGNSTILPNDKYKQQAGGIANQIMRIPTNIKVIQRDARFDRGKTHYSYNIARNALNTKDFRVGYTPPLMNGKVILSGTEARAAINEPSLKGVSKGSGRETWVDSVPLNVVSYSMTLPYKVRRYWGTRTKKDNVISLLNLHGLTPPAGLNRFKGRWPNTWFHVEGIPNSAAYFQAVKAHEWNHVKGHRRVFQRVLVPWDRNLQSLKRSGNSFRGRTEEEATNKLYKRVGGTPGQIAEKLFEKWRDAAFTLHSKDNNTTFRDPHANIYGTNSWVRIE